MSDESGSSRPLRILAYCPAAAPGVAGRIGAADYSYAFVLERFRPVLQSLGDVVEVHSESELQDAVATLPVTRRVLLSFAPVHRTPVGLDIATVPVFAWEFPNLPRWSEGGLFHDWAWTLAQCQGAVALSEHTREAVLAETHVPAWAIPAPIFDRFAGGVPSPADRTLRVTGHAIDSHQMSDLDHLFDSDWDSQPFTLKFGAEYPDTGRLVGFHGPEDWGQWSAEPAVSIVLPFPISGRVRLTLECVGFGANVGRTVTLSAGDASGSLALPESPRQVGLSLNVKRRTSLLTVSGLLPTRGGAGRDDRRKLGMGLMSLGVRRVTTRRGVFGLRRRRYPTADPINHSIAVDGIVFCSVLNPADGRKNWRAIVTAFCAAFRDEPNATLVLKMTHRSAAAFVGLLLLTLRESAPFRCRVIALRGHMTEAELAGLADASDFYVNASTGEGLCMPLMEFMSRGVPAVAPRHSAMADYLDDGNAFAVAWSEYPTCWPQDPSLRWRTRNYHVHWDSLRDQFRSSFALAVHQPNEHARMRSQAVRTLRAFSSDEQVRGRLSAMLGQVLGEAS